MKNENAISIKDVAKKVGVNISTVSRALSNSPQISEKKREEIKRVAKELGYRKNFTAAGLRMNKSFNLDVVFPDFPYIMSDYYSNILKGIDDVIGLTDYSISLSNMAHQDILEAKIQSRRADGLFIIGDSFSEEEYRFLMETDLPKVFVANRVPEYLVGKANNIFPDIKQASKLLSEQLIAAGETKNLLYISGGHRFYTCTEQLKGIRLACSGKKIHVEVMHSNFEEGPEGSYQLINDYLKENKDFPWDVVINASDEIALGTSKALFEHFPEKLKSVRIGGHDNTRVARLYPEAITSVDYNANIQGRKSAKLLLDFIENPNKSPEIITVDPFIV